MRNHIDENCLKINKCMYRRKKCILIDHLGGDLDWLLQRHRDTPQNNIDIMMKFYKR